MTLDLSTDYMGLSLRSPLVVSACPLSRDIGTVEKLAAGGAGAVVLFSLFEEQFASADELEQPLVDPYYRATPGEAIAEPAAYRDHVERLKAAIDIPVIASLNAANAGPWLDYLPELERAGADAIELSLYKIVADPTMSSAETEDGYVEIVRRARESINLPVAVKIAPFFTNLASFAARLDEAGASALVLFNRFYQPTIDIHRRAITLGLDLSAPSEARLPLMWIAMLAGQVSADLAATTGIHGAHDVIRAIMAGASTAMLCSVLLKYGVDRLSDIHRQLGNWLVEHDYVCLDDIRGSMRLAGQANPEDYKRLGYTRVISRSW